MTNKQKEFISNMIQFRDIDFARIGMMVEVDGDIGTITGMNKSANLDVIFTNQLKFGGTKHNCHPTYEVCYFDENGNILKDYRSSK